MGTFRRLVHLVRDARCVLAGHDTDTPPGVSLCPRCGHRYAR